MVATDDLRNLNRCQWLSETFRSDSPFEPIDKTQSQRSESIARPLEEIDFAIDRPGSARLPECDSTDWRIAFQCLQSNVCRTLNTGSLKELEL